jgi:hypothetical protein
MVIGSVPTPAPYLLSAQACSKDAFASKFLAGLPPTFDKIFNNWRKEW